MRVEQPFPSSNNISFRTRLVHVRPSTGDELGCALALKVVGCIRVGSLVFGEAPVIQT